MPSSLNRSVASCILAALVAGCSNLSLPSDNDDDIDIITSHYYVESYIGEHFSEWKVDDNGLYGIARTGGSTWAAVGNGGFILRTTNAGTKWTESESKVFRNLLAIADNRATGLFIAVGAGGAVTRSVDYGITWTEITSGTESNLLGVSAYLNRAIAVGDHTMIRTDNGGASWQSVTLDPSWSIRNVFMMTSDLAYAVGPNGLAIKSTDGGVTWMQLATPDATSYTDVTVPAPGVIIAVGTNAGKGVIAVSRDDGATWTLNNNFGELSCVASLDGVVWTASKTKIHRSYDAGLTWSDIPWEDTVEAIRDIYPSSYEEAVFILYGSGFEN